MGGNSSKDGGVNVESDLERGIFIHTFASSIRQNRIIHLKCKGYEKDDDRPRGNVRDDNEC